MPKLGRRFEPQQLQYYYNNTPSSSLPLGNAPFGNDYTPWIRPRIVGGRMVDVVDRRPNPPNAPTSSPQQTNIFYQDPYDVPAHGGMTSRFYPQIVNPIAEKPNNVDPHMLKEYTRKLHSVNQEFSVGPNGYGRWRPDSKDLGQKYPNLPPIDQNKTKNESSTIFEPESWVRGYQRNDGPRQSFEIERAQQPYDTARLNGGQNYSNGYNNDAPPVIYREEAHPYHPPPPRPPTLDEELEDIISLLPRDNSLTERPLTLNEHQKDIVLKVVARDLRGADMGSLKDVYRDVTKNYDRTLCGWCHYKNLFISLSNAKLNLSSDVMFVVASMFVSPGRLQEVNYEKFLSFIGSAVQHINSKGALELYSPRSKALDDKFYTKNKDMPKPWSPRASRPASPYYYDSDVGKLLNLTEQQLHEDGIDFEGLVARFQQVDREMRETLSADQIKGVLFSQGVKLQESVVNKILTKCVDNNMDGQYNWIKFIEFLEKVQPAKTGLPIPRSKKPLEYAKKVPSPGPNWPHTSQSEPAPPAPVTPLWKRDENPLAPSEGLLFDKNSARGVGGGGMYEQEQEQLRENSQRIDKMDQELKHLEADYEVDDMKKKMKSPREDSIWFKMFMEFSKNLYKQDSNNSGHLPADEVLTWTNTYNGYFNLDIPDSQIIRAIGDTTISGRVNLHDYLTKLAARDWV